MSYREIREIYAIHPFDFGKKERASKAMIIPSGIVKEFHIDKNTVLILRPHQNGTLTIETIRGSEQFYQRQLRHYNYSKKERVQQK